LFLICTRLEPEKPQEPASQARRGAVTNSVHGEERGKIIYFHYPATVRGKRKRPLISRILRIVYTKIGVELGL
jgi:hypothetical protein